MKLSSSSFPLRRPPIPRNLNAFCRPWHPSEARPLWPSPNRDPHLVGRNVPEGTRSSPSCTRCPDVPRGRRCEPGVGKTCRRSPPGGLAFHWVSCGYRTRLAGDPAGEVLRWGPNPPGNPVGPLRWSAGGGTTLQSRGSVGERRDGRVSPTAATTGPCPPGNRRPASTYYRLHPPIPGCYLLGLVGAVRREEGPWGSMQGQLSLAEATLEPGALHPSIRISEPRRPEGIPAIPTSVPGRAGVPANSRQALREERWWSQK